MMVMNFIFILFVLYRDILKAIDLDIMETNGNCSEFQTMKANWFVSKDDLFQLTSSDYQAKKEQRI